MNDKIRNYIGLLEFAEADIAADHAGYLDAEESLARQRLSQEFGLRLEEWCYQLLKRSPQPASAKESVRTDLNEVSEFLRSQRIDSGFETHVAVLQDRLLRTIEIEAQRGARERYLFHLLRKLPDFLRLAAWVAIGALLVFAAARSLPILR